MNILNFAIVGVNPDIFIGNHLIPINYRHYS